MARVAVVDVDGRVLNLIVADANRDRAPDGCALVDCGDAPVDLNWVWTGAWARPRAFARMKGDMVADVSYVSVLDPDPPDHVRVPRSEESVLRPGSRLVGGRFREATAADIQRAHDDATRAR